jgi:WD40 repeat protein
MAGAAATEDLIGRELAGYRVESVLGTGGMGVVYLAEHLRLGRVVALKVLAPALEQNERFRDRFLRESRIAAGLNHPNVIPIHDAGEADGVLYIAMRYVEATDLRVLLEREGRLEPARALSIAGQVGAALDAAHASGLVHRDVKPGNVLIAEGDHVYLTDFGLTKQSSSPSGLTATGEFLGTVDYVAPEQIEGTSSDHRADVYSLTCVLYECLTGEAPYTRESDLAVLWAHVQDEPPTLSFKHPELGTALDPVIARGLAKSLEERYATCAELVDAAASAIRREVRRDLPPELDALVPLADREEEVAWLREAWSLARLGQGRILFLTGARGIGKTRVAAELAREVHAEGGAVRYSSFVGSSKPAVAHIETILAATEPTLVVLDDLDAADTSVLVAIRSRVQGLESRPLLVLATYRAGAEPPALADMVRETALGGNCRRELMPVGPEEVREIAALYLGKTTAELSVETVLETTGGVPQRVHEVVSEWARGEASRRLAEAADRAAAGRSDLLAAAIALENNVIDLQRVRERANLYAAADEERDLVSCPFKGLASFEIADADVFFGRERLVAELVARLVGSTLLGVVGPSGSGKSSVVRAGLLPALAADVLPGSARWLRVLLRPGNHPNAALAGALSSVLPGLAESANPVRAAAQTLESDQRVVIVVDQFEETFTSCEDESERTAFVDALTEAAQDPQGRFSVVVAIRATFYGRCAAYSELADLLGANHVLVGPMQPDELRRAIELPARQAGLRVEPQLADALVADVADEPGGLPLLSTALLELWRVRDGRTLRLEHYERSGGIRGAVSRLAESVYGRLSESQQATARSLFLRLASGQAEGVVRRRAPLSEIDVDANEDARAVLSALTDSRLLTVSEGTVEVSHEALLREWPRLRTWLEEDAHGRRLREHLIRSARIWEEADRDPAELYRGARLASALDWQAEHAVELNELEREFLEESRAVSEREARSIRRTNRRLRALLVGAAILLAAAIGAGVVALIQRGNARDSAADARTAAANAATAAAQARDAEETAVAQRLGAEALIEDNLDRSLLLAREAVNLDDSLATQSNLRAALLRSPAAIGIMHGDGDRLTAMTGSPDGSTLYVGDSDGTLYLFDTETGAPIGDPVRLPGLIWDLALSPDGGNLMVVGRRPDEKSYLAAVDLGSSARNVRLLELFDPTTSVRAVAFSPDGAILATGEVELDELTETPTSATAVLRDPRSAEQRSSIPTTTPQLGALLDLVFTADGRELLWSSDASTDVFALDTGATVYSLPGGGTVGLSPDGRALGIGALDGSVTLVQVGGWTSTRLSGRHNGQVLGVSFSPDGKMLVTSGDDGGVIVWDSATEGMREVLRGHAGGASSPVFSRNGHLLYTSSDDGKIIVWDLRGDDRLGRPFTIAPAPLDYFTVAYSSTGTIATAAEDSISIWDATTLRRTGPPVRMESQVSSLAFDPSGAVLASASIDNRLALWETATGAPIAEVDSKGLTAGLAFTPDRKTLVTASFEGSIMQWDVDSLQPSAAAIEEGGPAIVSLALSPDGGRVATGHLGGDVIVWDLRARSKVFAIDVDEVFARALAFSPDGRLLAAAGDDGVVTLLDARTGGSTGVLLRGTGERVNSLDFSPDGRALASASTDGTVSLWDAASWKQIGAGLPVALSLSSPAFFGPVARFGPDGATLVAVVDSGQASLWRVDSDSWKEQACVVAGRNLTREEWRELLGDRPYQAVCPDLPA